MKSLASSSLNLFLLKYNLNYRGNISCALPSDLCLSRQETYNFLGCPQQLQASFPPRKFTYPRFTVSVLSSSHVQTEIWHEDNAEDDPISDAKEYESARVKFELRRECLFGQHFLLVGDDPTFGSWDPSEAIPLSWSDGHIWSVELDICVGKTIKYKFIMNQGDGTILWQPGEDRVLQTFQTAKTIKVTDYWDNLEPDVIEEESNTDLFEQIATNSHMQLIAENMAFISEYSEEDTDKDPRDSQETSLMPLEILSSENQKESVATNNDEKSGEIEVVSEKIELDVKNKLPHPYPSQEIDGNMFSKAKSNGNLDYIEEFPVLVPGMIPLTTAASEEPEAEKTEESVVVVTDVYRESDIIEEVNVLEMSGSSHEVQILLEEEPAKESRDSAGASDVVIDSNTVQHVENTQNAKDSLVLVPPLGNNILECSLQWGKKTLQKILMSLGLL